MKKVAVLIAILVLVSPAMGWCLSTTVDTFIDNRMKSDIGPVADTGKILNFANKGVDSTCRLATSAMDHKALSPIMTAKDETMKGVKSVINFTWDMATLKHFRGKKE